jgi:glycosyltransferase involved in cell wall biosynthesis
MNTVLIIVAKNEEHCIHLPIECMKEYVNRIVLIDDGSIDKTNRIASALGADIIRNQKTFWGDGCSEIYNWAISQVEEDWILILDADEVLDNPAALQNLQRFPEVNAWALPRRKWTNYSNNERMEFEAYPDWQPRFFKNIPENRFRGELHKVFLGELHNAYRGPHIEHLQEELSTDLKKEYRKDLYEHLGSVQGVHIERGHIKI